MSNVVAFSDNKKLLNAAEVEKIFDRADRMFGDIAKNVVELSKLYVESVSRDPTMRQKWEEKYPHISRSSWRRFEGIAAKKIDPLLAVVDYSYSAKIERLSLDDQHRLLTEPIPTVVVDERGKTDILKVKFEAMTPSQKSQVVAFDHVRTESEQKAWIESQKTTAWVKRPVQEQSREKYVIKKDIIIVPTRAEFTVDELWTIIKRATK